MIRRSEVVPAAAAAAADALPSPRLAQPNPRPAALGLVAGVGAGLLYGVLLASQRGLGMTSGMAGLPAADAGLGLHVLAGALAGVGFGLLCGRLARTPGAALMWGVAYGLAWWLAVPLTLGPLLAGSPPAWTLEAARAVFPLLAGLLVSYGAALGLLYWLLAAGWAGELRPARRGRSPGPVLESVAIGSLAGLIGGLAFGVWMERAGFFPLVAGIVRSDSPDVGRALHFAISVLIGASFGALFRPDVRGLGSSVAWGMAYGLIWWVLGPLTLLPWLLGRGAQWSLAAGRDAFPSLVGHVIYGLLLGVVYAAVARLWRLLFVESDPLRREPEGPGTRSLRALGLGAAASLAGGLVFTAVMAQTGALPVVARLVGASSAAAGFLVHMGISAVIGATYGLLFRREAATAGAALAWGLVYGLAWWFLGPLTLLPVLLGAGIQWSPAAALAAYPSLLGHLAYGGVTALVYQLLAGRHDPMLQSLRRRADSPRGAKRRRPPDLAPVAGTPAPALWALVLLAAVLLPLILSAGAAGAAGPATAGSGQYGAP
jgi:uncharacterized membrane protein YagU involved in acid resistance